MKPVQLNLEFPVQPLNEAATFLKLLGGQDDRFTFQTFSEVKQKGLDPLAKILHGTLNELYPKLKSLQDQGAGIFVMVNAGDFKGRSAANVKRIRAIWCDWDDHGHCPPVWPLEPSIIVKTSPGKFHFYWLLAPAEEMNRDDFKSLMATITAMGGDPGAKDLCRVLRMPGSLHMKDPVNPFSVELRGVSGFPYTVGELLAAFPPVEKSQVKYKQVLDFGTKPDYLVNAPKLEIGTGYAPVTADELAAMLALIPSDERDTWRTVGMALNDWDAIAGKPIWDEWSATSKKYNSAEQNNQWGQFRPGKGITFATIIQLARAAGYTAPDAAAFDRTEPDEPAFKRTEPNAPDDAAAFERSEPNAPGDCLRDHHSLTLAQLMALPPPPPAIHDGYYRLGEVTVVIGASSVGKTTMLMRDAFEIAQTGLTVVTISAEDEASNYARKHAALAMLDGCTDDAALQRVHNFTSALRNLILTTKTGADPNMPEFQRLVAALRPYKPSVVILETASSLGTGEETNGQLAALAKGLIWLARYLKAAVVISHHTNKQAALNADTSQHAARGGSSFTANTRETINIVKPTSEDMQGVMAQYQLPARYAKYAFDEQAFKDGRVILAHHAKCANGPETPPRGYLRVSISHGVERSFAPVSGALIRLERLDNGTAAHGRINAERQASAEKRAEMQAVIRTWIQNSRRVGERTYARKLERAGKGSRLQGGFSGKALANEIDAMVIDGTLKKRPAPQKRNPELMEICLPEEVEK